MSIRSKAQAGGPARARMAPPEALGIEGLVVVDEAHQIALFNSGAEALFGSSAGEMLGQPLDALFASPGASARLAAGGPAGRFVERARARQDEFPVEVYVSRLALNGQTMTALFLRKPGDLAGGPGLSLPDPLDAQERGQFEETRRLNDERLRVALRHSPTTVFNQDHELRYTWLANPTPEFMPEHILGSTDADIYPPEDAAQLTRLKRQVLETGAGLHDEISLTTPGGVRLYALTIEPLRDAAGRISGLTCACTDITERKRDEEALRESQFLLEKAQEVGHIGSWVSDIDPDGQLSWSLEACRIFGIKPDAFDGRLETFLDLVFTSDRELVAEALRAAKQAEGQYSIEHRIVRPDGAVRWVHARADIARHSSGQPQRLIGVVQDITERKQAEEAIQESETELRALLESAPVGIVVVDSLGRIVQANAKIEEMFGYHQFELFGSSIEVLLPERFKEVHEIHRTGYLNDPRNRPMGVGRDLAGRRKDGSEFAVEVGLSFIRAGGEVFVTGFITDITSRQQAELALQQANTELIISVNELRQRNQEITLLNEMGDLLQACRAVSDAYAVIARSAQQLFPTEAGALCILSSQNVLEAVATWGLDRLGQAEIVFGPDDCWALRRGRAHRVDNPARDLLCPHVNPAHQASCLCVPMLAQSELLGLLHLRGTQPGETFTGAEQQLAMTVAEHLALALSNLKLRESLRQQSIRDPLTGLFNRRYLEVSLERELRRVERHGHPLGVIMLDLDHFKNFNDTHGHAAGDALLRDLAGFLQTHVRGGDVACRYGGEEFILLLPEAGLEDTRARAEQLRVEARRLDPYGRGSPASGVTLSLGVAVSPVHGTTAEALLQAADAALYHAKAHGRDQVVIAPTKTQPLR